MTEIRNYETTFICRPDLEDEEQEAIQDKYKDIITENNGEINDINIWGTRKMAYEIKDYRKGFYTIINFNSKPDLVKELDRRFKIDDNVIRHLIVREEE